MSETEIIPADPNQSLTAEAPFQHITNFEITNVRQLQYVAKMAADSGLFGPLTKEQAGIIMWKCIGLGVDPLVGLEHIHVINRKPRPDGLLCAYLIKRSARVLPDTWKRTTSATEATVSIRLRSGETLSHTIKIADIPSGDRNKDNWKNYPDRMLYWRAVELLAQTHFEEQLLGMVSTRDNVIDLARVEHEAGTDDGAYGTHEGCGGVLTLHANATGGAYLRCQTCDATMPPPQVIRDTLRGRAEEFAPGERPLTDTERAEYEPPLPADSGDHGGGAPSAADVPEPESALPSLVASVTPEVPAAAPAEVSPPAAGVEVRENDVPPPDAPVDAAEKGGGSPDPVEQARAISYDDAWRDNARLAVVAHLESLRSASADQQRHGVAVLRRNGWGEDAYPSTSAYLEAADDERLSDLLSAFKLTPSLVPSA